MCSIGVTKMTVLVKTTMSHGHSLPAATRGSNQTLQTTLWKVLLLMLQCHKKLWKYLGVVEVSGGCVFLQRTCSSSVSHKSSKQAGHGNV